MLKEVKAPHLLQKQLTRRELLRGAGLALVPLILSACGVTVTTELPPTATLPTSTSVSTLPSVFTQEPPTKTPIPPTPTPPPSTPIPPTETLPPPTATPVPPTATPVPPSPPTEVPRPVVYPFIDNDPRVDIVVTDEARLGEIQNLLRFAIEKLYGPNPSQIGIIFWGMPDATGRSDLRTAWVPYREGQTKFILKLDPTLEKGGERRLVSLQSRTR